MTATSLAVKFQPISSEIILPTVDERISAFLDGDTNGGDLLHEIYDNVLDEPVPEHLLAILRDDTNQA